MESSQNKTVFITGGASGIGLATVKLLLSEGYNVALFSVIKPSPEDAEILSHIPNALVLIGDIKNKIHVKHALEKTVKRFGSLDVLINNAGTSLHKTFEETTALEWDSLIGVNIMGTLTVTHCALPYIKKSKGLIINISSGSALHAVSHLSIYSLTKAAILNFTQSLHKELDSHGVRVVAITPGSTNTSLFHKSSPHKKALYEPEDIAEIIVRTVAGKQKPDKNRIINPFKHLYK